MKTFVVLAVSAVLVSILFCPMVMAVPAMPGDVQIVQPDPSVPKEISAFWGKWDGGAKFFLIVEKIDEEKASLYHWQGGTPSKEGFSPLPAGWARYEAKVFKERGKYKLWFRDPFGNVELALKGDDLDWAGSEINVRLKRVP